jgi:hypothetical protein
MGEQMAAHSEKEGDLRYGLGFFTGVATSTIVLMAVLAVWWVPSRCGHHDRLGLPFAVLSAESGAVSIHHPH